MLDETILLMFELSLSLVSTGEDEPLHIAIHKQVHNANNGFFISNKATKKRVA